MTHARNGTHKKRLLKVRKGTRGYRGISKGHLRMGLQRVEKGFQHAYAHQRQKKSHFRSLWIQRINAACREHGSHYAQLVHALQQKQMYLNRKMLAELAIHEPLTFKSLLKSALK